MDLKYLGARIRERRNNMKMSQSALAEKIGISDKRTISDWENGKIPKLENIVNLSTALNCDPEYLLGVVEKPKITTEWIAEQIPLNDNVIDLLIELKKNCDDESAGGLNDVTGSGHMTASISDIMLELVISDNGYGGRNTMILDLMYRLISALRIVHEYDSEFDFASTMDWKYLPPELRDNERFRMARWEADTAADKITELFKHLIMNYAEVAAIIRNEAEEQNNGKE